MAGRKHGNVTALADAIGRALVTQLGLPYDCVNYIKGSATWAGLTMLTDELCRAAYNGEALVAGDQAVCRKGFKILDKTTKNSTDDEVAALIDKHDLKLTPSSPKAYQFGQEFNSCASAAMLALTSALGQAMAHGTVLAVCRKHEPTVLGMDRTLLDT